jgi:hypothetical protein
MWPADHMGLGMLGKSWIWAIMALTLAAGLGACSSGGGHVTTSAAHLASTARVIATSGSLPTYEPSKVVSNAGGLIRLSSADPASKVISFYKKALKNEGWSIVSIATTGASTSIVAMNEASGASISISSAGPADTSITVLLCICLRSD